MRHPLNPRSPAGLAGRPPSRPGCCAIAAPARRRGRLGAPVSDRHRPPLAGEHVLAARRGGATPLASRSGPGAARRCGPPGRVPVRDRRSKPADHQVAWGPPPSSIFMPGGARRRTRAWAFLPVGAPSRSRHFAIHPIFLPHAPCQRGPAGVSVLTPVPPQATRSSSLRNWSRRRRCSRSSGGRSRCGGSPAVPGKSPGCGRERRTPPSRPASG